MSGEAKPCGALAQANALAHEEIDAALLDMLEGITALDLPRAESAWDRFVRAFDAHTEVEEALVFTRYAALGPHPRGETMALFEADHASLRKVQRAALDAMRTMRESPEETRRVMVTQLGPLLRVRSVLEHHTLREERFLYPRLEAALSAQEEATLAAALKAARPSDRSAE